MTKVCIYLYSLTSGGAERVAVALAGFLANHNYDVTIITKRGTDMDFYTVPIEVHRISLNLNGEGKILSKITENISTWSKLQAHLRKIKPDVLIGMMTDSAVMSILAGKRSPAKIVVSERNFPGTWSFSLWYTMRKLLYRLADGHASLTPEAADWLKQNTGAKNVHIIPNSVQWPMQHIAPIVSPDSMIPVNKKLLLAVGSRPHVKGFDLLLDAFTKTKNDDWVLAILGVDKNSCEKEEYHALLNQIERLKLHNKVILPGCVGNVGDWYERANIFVLSSRNEGFGNVVLEAMAAGCATISFDCDSGPRHIIDHAKNGLLVEAENVDELSKAIDLLMDDPDMRKKLSKKAIEVRETYSEKNVLGKWVELIEGVQNKSVTKIENKKVMRDTISS